MSSPGEKMKKKTVLVVDDDGSVLKMIELILDDSGFDVIVASGGAEGLKLLEARHVDLIITDIIMPEMEGIELITRLGGEQSKIPILAISGGGRSRNMNFLTFAQKLGAKVVLEKPFRRDALVDAVNRALTPR
jgi:DNA-binding NtrC family response regulator